MTELTANSVQSVQSNQNVLFTDVAVSNPRDGIIHREGSGIITLNGRNRCGNFSRYKINFGANVAIPEGGTASTPVSFAIAINGEPIPTSSMIVTPTTAQAYWNISTAIIVDLPTCCCYTISVENTGSATSNVQNANLTIYNIREVW